MKQSFFLNSTINSQQISALLYYYRVSLTSDPDELLISVRVERSIYDLPRVKSNQFAVLGERA